MCVVELDTQGMATSTRLLRRWQAGTSARHHLINPKTGQSTHGLVAATIIAGQAWWAEVLAKVAMVDRKSTRQAIAILGGEGLFIDEHATVSHTAGWASFDGRV